MPATKTIKRLLNTLILLTGLLFVRITNGQGATLELLQGMYPLYGKGLSFPVSGFFLFGYPFGTDRLNVSIPAVTLVGIRGAPFGNNTNLVEAFNFFIAGLGIEVNTAVPIRKRWAMEFSVGGLWNLPFSRIILSTDQINQLLSENKALIGAPNDADLITTVNYNALLNSFPSVFASIKPIFWFNNTTFGHIRIGYMHGFNSRLRISGEYLAFNSNSGQGTKGIFDVTLPGLWQWIFVSIGGGMSF